MGQKDRISRNSNSISAAINSIIKPQERLVKQYSQVSSVRKRGECPC